MHRVTTILLACLALLAACAPEPAPVRLTDPRVIFAETFTNPLRTVTVEANGGPLGDGWMVFTTNERIVLREGELFAQVDPAPAVAYFTGVAPELTGTLSAEGVVCLAAHDHEKGPDSGASLLFELGAGRYFLRRWGPVTES